MARKPSKFRVLHIVTSFLHVTTTKSKSQPSPTQAENLTVEQIAGTLEIY